MLTFQIRRACISKEPNHFDAIGRCVFRALAWNFDRQRAKENAAKEISFEGLSEFFLQLNDFKGSNGNKEQNLGLKIPCLYKLE